MENETYDKGMALLSSVLPNLELSKDRLKTFRMLLDDLPDEKFKDAIVRICRETKELYPGTNIVALIREKAQGADKHDLHVRVIMAWHAVQQAIEQHGHYVSVQFDDPVIHSCVQALGGWIELCSTNTHEMVWKEKKFKEVYPVFITFKRTHPKHLVGWEEWSLLNSYSNFGQGSSLPPPPILIETGLPKLEQKQIV